MGLLTEGTPLSWNATKKHADFVRKHGIEQFINLYDKLKDRQNDCLKWGDEIEYILVRFDDEKKVAQVSLRGPAVMNKLQQAEREAPNDVKVLWRPEFGAYMLEGTPGKPYGFLMSHFNVVEANMLARREEVKKLLEPNEVVLCMTSYPRLGCESFTFPVHHPTPTAGYLKSLFTPDEVVFQDHPRFLNLAKNIRERRGSKVAINIPIFKDKRTPNPFIDPTAGPNSPALPNNVYMDSMAFGMGCCCLQVTFQASNISEARNLYDQLTPLCPIVMALSASSPIHHGYLSDLDCRWSVIAASVDDRTPEELGQEPLKNNKFRIHKSRYDSIDSYLSPEGEAYNDLDLVYDKEIYKKLRSSGIDHLLAQHIAHLFIRDPISLFEEKLQPSNDYEDTDHFENLQSTNWQTMRFKPPPPNTSIGWRVEFRPMEIQMTEFENAAYVVFVVLMTRVILSYRLNFLIPISKVDENMLEAQKRDAVKNGKFYFRHCITTCGSPPDATGMLGGVDGERGSDYVAMTINEIINGKGSEFPGLVPLIRKFLSSVDVDVDTQCTIQQYLNLIQRRASGELMTTAKWIREFVDKHPKYKHDSHVPDSINYDLLRLAADIQNGKRKCPELIGNPTTKTNDEIPEAIFKANEQTDC